MNIGFHIWKVDSVHRDKCQEVKWCKSSPRYLDAIEGKGHGTVTSFKLCIAAKCVNQIPVLSVVQQCFVNLQYSSVRYCRPGALIGNGPKIVGKKMNGKNGWKKALEIEVGLSDCIA